MKSSPNEPAALPPRSQRAIESLSPEARRRRAVNLRNGNSHTANPHLVFAPPGGGPDGNISVVGQIKHRVGPGTRAWEIAKRTLLGTYEDGLMYAGNLAYLSMLAIFPFFILGAALFELIGGPDNTVRLIAVVLASMPPTVREAIEPVANDVINSREGWLLWLGAGVALWTVSSLIETIREILRRAYGTTAMYAFWKYRLFSAGLILGAVVLLMASLFAQVVIGAVQQTILAGLPQFTEAIGALRLSRIVPAVGLGLSLYLLFFTLTPSPYRVKGYPKWPGALFTAVWWLSVTTAMPPVLSSFLTYDLTYGSLAGIMVALFFFWLVGLGLVIGAQLNAALAEPEADLVGGGDREALAGLVQTGAQIGGRIGAARCDDTVGDRGMTR